MLCRKTDYLKMEKIEYEALKIVFNSNESFEDLILHSNKCLFIKNSYVN